MHSTGEVMGRDHDRSERRSPRPTWDRASRSRRAARSFISIRDDDKRACTFMAKKKLVELGYELVATRGTARFLRRNGVPCRDVFKVREGRPNAVDMIENGEVQLVINTPLGRGSDFDDRTVRRSRSRSAFRASPR